MKISLIAAMDNNNGIGFNNKLLWSLPSDLKWMKEKTMGNPIVMGRKTYEDIITYTKGKPLIGRKNIVLTRGEIDNIHNDFLVVNNIQEIYNHFPDNTNLFVIGGANIYNQFIDICDELIITHVHSSFKADAFFPKINYINFNKTFEQENYENGLKFSFCIYSKKT